MSEDYVSRAAWLADPGRPEAIDEVADTFERPVERERFWATDHTAPAGDPAEDVVAGWPAHARSWWGDERFGTGRRAG